MLINAGLKTIFVLGIVKIIKQFPEILGPAHNENYRRWLDQQRCEPRTAWYRSVGEDLKGIVYPSAVSSFF